MIKPRNRQPRVRITAVQVDISFCSQIPDRRWSPFRLICDMDCSSYQRIKWPGRKVDHSRTFNCGVKKKWSYPLMPVLSVYGVGLKPFGCWDRGIESRWELRCSSFVLVVCWYMWYDMIRYDIWYDIMWCDVIWYMIWYDMKWHDMTWYDFF